MTSPEQGSDSKPKECPLPWYMAALFRREHLAGSVYESAQTLLYRSRDCDLSAFRFHVEQAWYVTILGEEPTGELRQNIENVLRRGTRVILPKETVQFLLDRRLRANEQAPWVERHFLE